MPFSVSRDSDAFESAGDGLHKLKHNMFCQPRHEKYLQREGCSSQFRHDYMFVCFMLPIVLLISLMVIGFVL